MVEWTVEFFDQTALDELAILPSELRAKFQRIVELIRIKGLEQVREPYIKHLEEKLWEMRLIGKNQIARSIYVTATGKRIIVLHTFVKKTDKTPARALAIARARAREVT